VACRRPVPHSRGRRGPGFKSRLPDHRTLALRVGVFGGAIACLRQRAVLAPAERLLFDTDLTTVVRRAIGAMPD